MPEGVRVEREDDGTFRVVGRQAERAVALSDLTNADALDVRPAPAATRSASTEALARAGARAGDVVRIGTFSFDYEPDDEWDSSRRRHDDRPIDRA